ncbi:E3 UFM1-protein ligase 1 [Acipenser ruthenus]|uniref:E3 UFM1-protein ligase 1 n=1 Tax=Acipenser ruthenus TaxID=7906 RepID=A0A662YQR3_ACIRT|nr:E3 UFM1-protein ligase 1 [Acipenser ruthenus]
MTCGIAFRLPRQLTTGPIHNDGREPDLGFQHSSDLGGRVNIVDLQQITNVDLVHVESRASDIAKSDKSIQLVLGQLIDENYLDQLAEEVNDRLQEAGQVTIAELCKSYDLPGDFLTESIVDQVEASVEEAVNSGTWTDVQEIKSNPVFLITEDDLKQASVVVENAAFSKKDKRDERKKKASEGSGSVKGSGGGNAREIRIRKTKKKGRKDDDSDDETTTTTQNRSKQQEVPFMTQGDIEEVLQKHVQDCPEEMLSELAEHLIRPLTKMYQEVVRSVFMSSTSSSTGASRKQTVKDLQEEITNLFNNIRLFEKGTKLFSDETQANIAKHVLKTVCTDITNLLFNFLGAELMMAVENYNSITNEVRIKILGKLPEETKGPLTKLHNSLNAKSLEEFLTNLDSVAEVCGIMLKKGDKKRERQALFQHRQALIEQLKVTEDPALVLHLTSVLLFQFSTNCMLHAPGRCVPQIIATLSTRIPEDQHKLLSKYQGLVVKQLVGQNRKASQTGEDSEEKQQAEEDTPDAVRKELLSLTSEVKDLALRPRKISLTEE